MNIGIMQSRLSPIDMKKGYQYWPKEWWDSEFVLARQLNIPHIEWIYDDNHANSLNTDEGQAKVLHAINQNLVQVESICADYFIKHPFWSTEAGHATSNIKKLNMLIIAGFKLGARNIVIPCVEESTIDNYKKKYQFIHNVLACLPTAGQYMMNICIECAMPFDDLAKIVEKIDNERFGICMDTGNWRSAGLSLDVGRLPELPIKHVHFKDCMVGGKNIELGTGDVNFYNFIAYLERTGYDGTCTLQCARHDEFDLDFIKSQYQKIKSIVREVHVGQVQT